MSQSVIALLPHIFLTYSCVVLGQVFNITVPQFPYLQNMANDSIYSYYGCED